MNCPNLKNQKGQTLVVVLVLLVIAAVVSTAVAYRAIQDVRIASEERSSAKAAAQVDSFVEIAMDPDFWDDLWSDDVQGCATYTGSGDVCPIDDNFWNDYVDSSLQECDEWKVFARREDQVSSFFLGKDEVVEFDLRTEAGVNRDSSTNITISWTGSASYLIIRYMKDGDIVEDIALTYGDPEDWNIPPIGTVSDLGAEGNTCTTTLGAVGEPNVIRIKALYGDALLAVDGLADEYFQVGALKAYCYIGDIYRESVAQVVLREFVPSVFDYALFDASGSIDKEPTF